MSKISTPIQVYPVASWVHSRRKFEEAKDCEPRLVAKALDYMVLLYGIEKEIKKQGLSGVDKRLFRLDNSKPIVESYFTWL